MRGLGMRCMFGCATAASAPHASACGPEAKGKVAGAVGGRSRCAAVRAVCYYNTTYW